MPQEAEKSVNPLDREIAEERGRMHNAIQGIHSGSRDLQNMAGMLQLMNRLRQADNEKALR